MQYTSKDETAVCNLASINLATYVDAGTRTFDYEKLHEVVKCATNNLNRVIDITFYPTTKCKLSNLRHRPIAIGVSGLANVFAMMDIAFESDEAANVNQNIFETIYHAALEKSNEIAIQRGNIYLGGEEYSKNKSLFDTIDNIIAEEEMNKLPQHLSGSYSSFVGSPISKGIFQFDMWENGAPGNTRYDWDSLRESIIANGIRNSLLTAPMPTASTSQIFAVNECFEPFTSNMYSRRTKSGTFVMINKYLIQDLIDMNLWSIELKNNIIEHQGSIQHLLNENISEHMKNKYKTVWEMSMKSIINMSLSRGRFCDQSQSMNIWIESPSYQVLTNMFMYGWKRGAKTGLYYLRRKGPAQSQQFTIEPKEKETKQKKEVDDDEDVCEMCSA
jgi:ribonucleoside-diphosphate reductase alpha chain/ribonucleoside-diphosphate reductase subunit M1